MILSDKWLSMQPPNRTEDRDFTGPIEQDGWLFLCLLADMLLGVAEFSLKFAFILTYYLGNRHSPQPPPTHLSPTVYEKPSDHERPNLLESDLS